MQKDSVFFYCKRYKKKISFPCTTCVFEKKCAREKHILERQN
jgi:hypothetical protein